MRTRGAGLSTVLPHKRLLVVGARGLVGQGVLSAFDGDADWSVVALSRRSLDFPTDATHVSVDLTDRIETFEMLGFLGAFTHVVYAALYEQEDLVAGWRDTHQIEVNVGMLRNLLDAVEPSEHLTLLQGTKAYGAHLGPMLNPGKEWHDRPRGPNFYWPQEDLVRERANAGGWRYTVLRPQIVCGLALGSPMNMTLAIGVFAAIAKAMGEPLRFPGGPAFVTQATDARLLGRAVRWFGAQSGHGNEIYNITNGDELVWRSVWTSIADSFEMEVGDDRPMSLAEEMPKLSPVWNELVRRFELMPYSMDALVGNSWQFADAIFGLKGGQNTLLSTIKARKHGFAECIDTEDMFRNQFADLQNARILPT